MSGMMNAVANLENSTVLSPSRSLSRVVVWSGLVHPSRHFGRTVYVTVMGSHPFAVRVRL